LKAVCSAVIL